ncbi:MAG TPA: hypothetical protein DC038_07130, partial [Clostridiales bacterium]|nr:hypothetical protein [Clostridiales bacterium]
MLESKIDSRLINSLVDEEISHYWNIVPESANSNQVYRALSTVIRDILLDKRNCFINEADKDSRKQVYYICMEFLTGKSLRNHL